MKILVMLATAMLVASAAAAKDDKYCLAEAMYFEARNEGWRGMLAVGVVVQNRVKIRATRIRSVLSCARVAIAADNPSGTSASFHITAMACQNGPQNQNSGGVQPT